jgi:hypothetical protein
MLADLTMIATLPVNPAALASANEDLQAQQPDVPHPVPGLPHAPEQPVVPPDDPNRTNIEREPSIDPPSTEPPVQAPSEKPGITEPPAPRA